MIRYLRYTFISLTVLSLGLSAQILSKHLAQGEVVNGVKTLEAYWEETQLQSESAIDLINNENCGSSERYFLACINGLVSAAQKQGRIFDHNLKWSYLTDQAALFEKQYLESWKEWYRSNPEQAAAFPFAKALRQVLALNKKYPAMGVGLAVNGFISVFRDPHTYLMPLGYYNEVVAQTDSKSSALGLILAKDQTSYFIRKVLDESPAEKAGLQKGDIIVSVNSKSVHKLSLPQVSELLKGEIGQEIEVEVLRGENKFDIELVRSMSRIPSVTHRTLPGIRPVGLVTINKFAAGTCEKVDMALAALKDKRIKGLLLDLRDNPGGQMEEASCVAGLFLGKDKKIFELRYLDPGKEVESYDSLVEQVYEGPVAVLINSGSASASEIVAGSLKDWGRAVLVGERTFGKGSFQEGEVWSENEALALFQTKGFYYLPSGKSPQLIGIEPDVAVVFKKSLVSREADQYWNPLKAPPRKPWVGDLIAQQPVDCLSMEDQSTDDLEINTAKESLFCSAAVAGGSL